jgi:hypothetical protein
VSYYTWVRGYRKILSLLGILILTSAAPGLGQYRIPRSDNIFDILTPSCNSYYYIFLAFPDSKICIIFGWDSLESEFFSLVKLKINEISENHVPEMPEKSHFQNEYAGGKGNGGGGFAEGFEACT